MRREVLILKERIVELKAALESSEQIRAAEKNLFMQEVGINIALKAELLSGVLKDHDSCQIYRDEEYTKLEVKYNELKAELAAYKANNYDPAESIRLTSEIIALKTETAQLKFGREPLPLPCPRADK